MLSILWTILIGLVVGVLAKLLHPGRENLGLFATTLLGIAGSLAATYLGRLVGFYAATRVRYAHTVWHLFVLGGSVCHFVAILGWSGRA